MIIKVKGKDCLLDEADYAFYSQWAWQLNSVGYVRRTLKKAGTPDRTGLLHRLILGAQPGQSVDHINGNRLDNRRENLRLCSQGQNMANSRKRRNTSSRFKGVSWDNRAKRWIVDCRKAGFSRHFRDELKAAKFADEIMFKIYGTFARLNFPNELV